MNEHDSERMKGMLESLGYAEAAQRADADLILFNTCSIREKADERFVAHLREAKALKRGDPERVDRRRRLLGAVGQGRGLPPVPVRRRRVRPRPGPQARRVPDQRLAHRAGLLRVRGLHRPPAGQARARRSRAGCRSRVGCNCGCSYCIVPSTRGREGQPPARELVAEVERARRRRRARGHAARPERQLLRPRPAAASRARSPSCCARSTRSTASTASATRARTPRTCARTSIRAHAELPSLCEHIHLPLQSGSSRDPQGDAPHLRPRALPRPRRADPRARPRLRADDRHHRRLPGRDRGRLRARRSRSPRRSATTAPSPSSTRRAAGPRRRAHRRPRAARGRGRAHGAARRGRPAPRPRARAAVRRPHARRARRGHRRAPTRPRCAAARATTRSSTSTASRSRASSCRSTITGATSQTLAGEESLLAARRPDGRSQRVRPSARLGRRCVRWRGHITGPNEDRTAMYGVRAVGQMAGLRSACWPALGRRAVAQGWRVAQRAGKSASSDRVRALRTTQRRAAGSLLPQPAPIRPAAAASASRIGIATASSAVTQRGGSPCGRARGGDAARAARRSEPKRADPPRNGVLAAARARIAQSCLARRDRRSARDDGQPGRSCRRRATASGRRASMPSHRGDRTASPTDRRPDDRRSRIRRQRRAPSAGAPSATPAEPDGVGEATLRVTRARRSARDDDPGADLPEGATYDVARTSASPRSVRARRRSRRRVRRSVGGPGALDPECARRVAPRASARLVPRASGLGDPRRASTAPTGATAITARRLARPRGAATPTPRGNRGRDSTCAAARATTAVPAARGMTDAGPADVRPRAAAGARSLALAADSRARNRPRMRRAADPRRALLDRTWSPTRTCCTT